MATNVVHDFGPQSVCVCACVCVCVCQMEPVMPGGRAPAVPLCVVRAQCVLSAAVSDVPPAQQQHPRSATAADGVERTV